MCGLAGRGTMGVSKDICRPTISARRRWSIRLCATAIVDEEAACTSGRSVLVFRESGKSEPAKRCNEASPCPDTTCCNVRGSPDLGRLAPWIGAARSNHSVCPITVDCDPHRRRTYLTAVLMLSNSVLRIH